MPMHRSTVQIKASPFWIADASTARSWPSQFEITAGPTWSSGILARAIRASTLCTQRSIDWRVPALWAEAPDGKAARRMTVVIADAASLAVQLRIGTGLPHGMREGLQDAGGASADRLTGSYCEVIARKKSKVRRQCHLSRMYGHAQAPGLC
jgi:hypothetical protein